MIFSIASQFDTEIVTNTIPASKEINASYRYQTAYRELLQLRILSEKNNTTIYIY